MTHLRYGEDRGKFLSLEVAFLILMHLCYNLVEIIYFYFMKIANFNYSLGKLFLLLLIISQAAIFVSLKAAAPNQNQILPANFFLSQTDFQPGDKAVWLVGLDKNVDWQVVNFLLENKEQNISLYFQTFKNEEGLYQADSFWDTSDYPGGNYSLSVVAQNFDEQGKISTQEQSELKTLYLASPVNLAISAVTDTGDKNSSSTPEDNNATSTAVAVEEFLMPPASAEVSGQNIGFSLKLNQVIASDQIVGGALFSLDGKLATTLTLAKENNSSAIYNGVLADSSLYANGDYYLVIWLNNDQNYISEPLVFKINNIAEEEVATDPNNYQIVLRSPQNNSQINDKEFLVSLTTNFDAQSLGFLFLKEDDPSIGTELTIERTDGFVWNKLVDLDASFITGKYILSSIAVDLNGVIHEEIFTLNVNLAEAFDNATSSNPLLPALPGDENTSSTNATSTDDELATSTVEIILAPYIDDLCLAENISEAEACEEYLSRVYVEKECEQANIFNLNDCKNYTAEKYLPKIQCLLANQNQCQALLQTDYLNRLAVKEQAREKTVDALKNNLQKNISVKDLQASLVADNLNNFLPLSEEATKQVFLASAESYTALQASGGLDFLSNAVLVFDADADALSDDLELYYGTDLNNPDSDSDGYLDGQEVANSYNPLGAGVLNKESHDLAKILSQKLALAQPKFNASTTTDLSIDEFSKAENSLILTGKAPANTWLNLYFYSQVPLLVSTKSNEQGDWSYQLEQALVSGDHQVYLAINDSQGKIIKQSAPLAITIGQEQVSEPTGNDTNNTVKVVAEAEALNFWQTYRWYILSLGILVMLLLSTYLFFKFRKEKNTL